MMTNKKQILKIKTGFTLTELLVVILIIATLAAISLTAMTSLKRRANSAKAVSSLRELGALTLGLASERNGRLPNEGHYPGQPGPSGAPYEDDKSWDGYVLGYLGADDIDFNSTPPKVPVTYESMFFHGNDDPSPATGGHAGNARRTFVYNRSLSDVSISTIDSTARTAMLGELPWQIASRRVAFKSNSFMDINRMIPNPKNGNHLNPAGKFNFVFVDGHVEQLSPKESVGKGSISKPGGIWTIRGDD
jgi:prepilin-type N-terminal cleavage/methylation domain-containing protein/prepilin-type processing-associated H-X9-DG protein